ncbi:MAG: hypothetical protein DSY87_07310 [Methylococcus sp.]|nr:MAG: hypothetical protein DSY87_07310 [Methylococcus sp.]
MIDQVTESTATRCTDIGLSDPKQTLNHIGWDREGGRELSVHFRVEEPLFSDEFVDRCDSIGQLSLTIGSVRKISRGDQADNTLWLLSLTR